MSKTRQLSMVATMILLAACTSSRNTTGGECDIVIGKEELLAQARDAVMHATNVPQQEKEYVMAFDPGTWQLGSYPMVFAYDDYTNHPVVHFRPWLLDQSLMTGFGWNGVRSAVTVFGFVRTGSNVEYSLTYSAQTETVAVTNRARASCE